MGITKSNLFTVEQNEMATFAKAFAHPARVAIIEFLLESNRCINGDLVHELGLAQSTISQHLKELKSIGLIKGSIEGPSMSYCINEEVWVLVKNQFQSLFGKYRGQDCC